MRMYVIARPLGSSILEVPGGRPSRIWRSFQWRLYDKASGGGGRGCRATCPSQSRPSRSRGPLLPPSVKRRMEGEERPPPLRQTTLKGGLGPPDALILKDGGKSFHTESMRGKVLSLPLCAPTNKYNGARYLYRYANLFIIFVLCRHNPVRDVLVPMKEIHSQTKP